MRIVGLTGGIATGKSTVSNELKRLGVPVVDADKIAHDAARNGTWGYRRLLKAFGTSILREDGSVDRELLGEIVFSDPAQRRKLNSALQPAIAAGILRQLVWLWLRGAPAAVLDAPLLFEARIARFTRPVIVVACRPAAQEARLMARDGLTAEQARSRVGAQMPLADKCARADFVIDNSGSKEAALDEARHVWREVRGRPRTFLDLACSRVGLGLVLVALLGCLLLGLKERK